ncbi:MAG: hypothetical protein JW760_10245 [Spirochaetales bacterium]|nr:hypothetical protein [Spirochaetales bacterium]
MRKVSLVLIPVLFLLLLLSCQTAPTAKNVIAYPTDYDLYTTGASCYDGCGDHFDSPYFKHPDFYNMESQGSLVIIPRFETYQQTTEYTCGAGTILMVINHFGVADQDELSIAEVAEISEETGVSVAGIVKYFEKEGWNVTSSLNEGVYDGYTFEDPAEFTAWVLENLGNDIPILVDWLDWAGHWQAIIGYDTMGTEDHFGDDVLVMADPYDTSDHWQDGYFIVPAERFFYMWREGVYESSLPLQQPWVIATPAK